LNPISEKTEAQFRGPTSSESYNKLLGDNYYDLVQLFNTASEFQVTVPANMAMLVTENLFLQRKLASLKAILDDIEASISETVNVISQTFYGDVTLKDAYGFETSRLVQDAEYGILTLGSSAPISKLYLTDTEGVNFIPKTLKCRVYESTTGIDITQSEITDATLVAEEDETLSIVDGDSFTYWNRGSVGLDTDNALYICVDIVLPANIINHTRANQLVIQPTPLSSMSLLDVQYLAVGGWQRLPSFPVSETTGLPVAQTELGQTKICFPTRNMTGIRLYFKQPNWFFENGTRKFVYGFRGIEVDYVNFKTEEERIRIQFSIPDETKQFVSIDEVIPLFAPGSVTESCFTFYKVYVGSQEYNLGETLPILTKSVDIEIGLNLLNDSSPCLRGIQLKYDSA
jgi:hypothetical protein